MKKERPETLQSTTYKVPSGFGNIYICVSTLDDHPFEVFVIVGKAGSDIQAKAEAVGRMTSLALRNEIPLNEIVKQLVDIRGNQTMPWKDTVIWSIPDAVAKILMKYYTMKGKEDATNNSGNTL
jgi:ribonucleoside-diphosphate reductase alpha chain